MNPAFKAVSLVFFFLKKALRVFESLAFEALKQHTRKKSLKAARAVNIFITMLPRVRPSPEANAKRCFQNFLFFEF